jgi:hypothetical protein
MKVIIVGGVAGGARWLELKLSSIFPSTGASR